MNNFSTIWIKAEEVPTSCSKCCLMDSCSDFPNLFCSVTNELLCDDVTECIGEECPLRVLPVNNGVNSRKD